MPVCQTHQPFARAVQQPCIGREGDSLRLHGGIDDDTAEVRRLGRAASSGQRQALLQQCGQLFLTHSLAASV
jgi:hypothetical protein